MTIRRVYRDNRKAGFVRQASILFGGIYSIRDSEEPGLKLPFKVEGDVVTFPPSKLGVDERIDDTSFTGNVLRPTDEKLFLEDLEKEFYMVLTLQLNVMIDHLRV